MMHFYYAIYIYIKNEREVEMLFELYRSYYEGQAIILENFLLLVVVVKATENKIALLFL